jgi:HEAT repeat protein
MEKSFMWKSIILTGSLLAAMVPARAADLQALDNRLSEVAKWEYDQSRESTQAIADIVVNAKGSPVETRQIEARFDRFLERGATLAGEDFICKQLSLIGSAASVPVLSRLLLAPNTTEIARFALERIPGPEVDRALGEALPKASGRAQIGLINSLGRRRNPDSVRVLQPLALGADVATAVPALFALAEIADPAAISVLDSAQAKAAPQLRVAAAEASLRSAERLSAGGQQEQGRALAIAHKLYAANQPAMVRVGAFRLIAAAAGAQASPIIMEALRGPDARLQAMAIAVLAQNSPNQLISEIPHLGEAAQIRALGVLAEAGNRSALPVFTKAAEGSSKPVRIAALEGMTKVGDTSSIPLLAKVAVSGDQAEETAARNSLAAMPGKDVDRAVIDSIRGADSKSKVVLIRVAGQRGSAAAGPALLEAARSSDTDVRHEGLRALHDAASASEIPGMLALVTKPVEPDDRDDAVHSLAAVLRRSDNSQFHAVVSAYTPDRDVATRGALLQVMGQSGITEGMPLLRSALADQNAELRRAAIVSLSAWPDDAPIPDLLTAARSDAMPAHQVLALRGVIRLIGLPGSSHSTREKAAVLVSVMGLAKEPAEKRAILSLLPRYPTKEALDLATSAMQDPQVAAEAKAAAARLERSVKR